MATQTILMFALALTVFAQEDPYDALYRGDEGNVFNQHPNAFLVRMTNGLSPGKALDVGMGQGRNALYLASKGWTVTGFDPSKVGVETARRQAGAKRLALKAIVATSEEFSWGREQWDLIVLTYVGFRNLTSRVMEALRPGGMVLVESYHSDTAFLRVLGPEHWENNELPTLFAQFRLLQYEDVMDRPDWGIQYGSKNRLVRLLAQKPVSRPNGCEFDGRVFPFGEKAGRPGELPMLCTSHGWQFQR
ncbi:MAG TPA: class I SAM-dependent methyltransferase [Bryobacteraceae bacterium]|nr:class I SAM-dependent methyltransferase [Bryobacteraceae bacterium]